MTINRDSHFVERLKKELEQKPRSKAFAPLAEAYRKLGMHNEALEVLRQGLKYNPSYVLGFITLANCYYDTRKFELAYSTLKPLLGQNLENIHLQKLFAQICLQLNYLDEALESFKCVLFLNPKDDVASYQVKNLEGSLENPTVTDLTEAPYPVVELDDDLTHWSVFSSDKLPSEHRTNLFSGDTFTEEAIVTPTDSSKKLNSKAEEVGSPAVVTHTLVDLYVAQGFWDKAIELLVELSNHDPSDASIHKKINELREKKNMEEGSIVISPILAPELGEDLEQQQELEFTKLIERARKSPVLLVENLEEPVGISQAPEKKVARLESMLRQYLNLVFTKKARA